MRETIPIMQILDELKIKKIVKLRENPEVFCKAFEENKGTLELATVPKLRPKTKHIIWYIITLGNMFETRKLGQKINLEIYSQSHWLKIYSGISERESWDGNIYTHA